MIILMAPWSVAALGAPADGGPSHFEQFNAREAVHHGNQLLIDGDAPQALEAYKHAEGLMPDALEIPFVQGLGHYAAGEFDLAREAFEKAAVSKNRKLADDATYSIGTTYHAEALEGSADPQLAIEKLENALQRYQNVLASQSDHNEARDAIVKAASMRRQLKRMLEQQQQQQNQDQDQQNNEENPEDQEQQQGQDQNQQDEQQQDEEQQQQSGEESEQQQSEQQDQPQEDESQQAEASDQQEDQDQQQMQASEAQREEQTSREQAQRRLREMMQNIRERQKRRREKPQPFQVVPVDKDW